MSPGRDLSGAPGRIDFRLQALSGHPTFLSATSDMGRIFGFGIGIIWLGLAFAAFNSAANGWALDRPDWGFWWSVVGALLAIAGTGSLVGTYINTRESRS